MVTRQPWNSKHRNPSKAHRAKIANHKATAHIVKLVHSGPKLTGKAAKKMEKRARRIEREKEEAETKAKVEAEAAAAEAAATPAPAPVAAAPAQPAAAATPAAAPKSAGKKKKAAKAASGDAMDVDDLMEGRQRVESIRKKRKPASKATAMAVDE